MVFQTRTKSFAGHFIRSILLTGCAALAPATSCALAQAAAQPAEQAQELPPVEVTTKAAAKQAKKKSTSEPAQSAAAQSPVSGDVELASGAGNGGETGPGLNLHTPAQTGSRLGLSPLETPASVEVIPGNTIRDRGQTNINDAVTQNVAGFTSTAAPGNGGTGLAARGFAGHGSVMQLYDGTRLYVGSGTVTFPFDTWSAERIEVLRGPASVLYGEGAVGGVINVVPKKPTDYVTHEGEVAFGTDNTQRFGVGSGGPISDQLFYRFDASGIRSDGWLEREGDFHSLAFSGALTYRPSSDLQFTVSHDHADQSPLRYWGTPLVNGRIPDSIRDKSYNVRDGDVSYVDNWTQFKTEWSPTDWLELRNVAYRLTSNRHWHNVEGYRYFADIGKVIRTDYIEIFHDQEQIGNRFDATFRTSLGGGIKNALVVGFDINQIDFLNRSNSPYAGTSDVDLFNPDPGWFTDRNNDPARPRVESDTFQYAFFAENQLTLSKELTLVAGIRLDEVTLKREDPITPNSYFEKDFSETSWRVGAVYTPVPGLAFYAQYATAVDPVSGALISMNLTQSQYRLSSSRQYEVGVKQSFWQGRGEWTLAAYDIEKSDILSRDPNNSQIVRQVGQQSSRGIEASLGVQLTDTLRYDGNVALLEARYDDFMVPSSGTNPAIDYAGYRPPNVPEQVVNSWLTWAFLPRWEAYAGVQWIGSIYNDNANTVKRPSSTVVNMGLSYDVDERSEIALRVFNVFDEKYATGGGSYEWQIAPPRSAELSYRIKY